MAQAMMPRNAIREGAMAKPSTKEWARGRRPAALRIAFALAIASSALSCSGRPPASLAIVAGGDCLLDRYDGRLGAREGGDRRWDALIGAARGSDAFLFNLETTVGEGGHPKDKRFVFRAPAGSLAPLSRFPRPVAALANNHSMDYGPEGLLATVAALDEAGIAHAGGGATSGPIRAIRSCRSFISALRAASGIGVPVSFRNDSIWK